MIIVHLGGTSWLAYEENLGILIDAGRRPDGAGIIKHIRLLGLNVPLIFLTHTHYDHAGGVEAVRQATGAKVFVGAAEAEMLHRGHTPVPMGTNTFGRALLGISRVLGSTSRDHYKPVLEDVTVISDSGPVEGFGPEMTAYHLEAHTMGSIGLKIGDDFFAGDTVFGIGGLIYPPFADLPDEFPAAWSTILGSDAKRIYPGHGKPFDVSELEKKYKSLFPGK